MPNVFDAPRYESLIREDEKGTGNRFDPVRAGALIIKEWLSKLYRHFTWAAPSRLLSCEVCARAYIYTVLTKCRGRYFIREEPGGLIRGRNNTQAAVINRHLC